jgi:tetratricopeptide (TPR) repeat protein
MAIALLTVLALSALQNLFADYYYQKYINTKLKSSDAHLISYITNGLSMDETNPKYLYEFGNTFLEVIEKNADYEANSESMITKGEDKSSLNSIQLEKFNFLKRYKNISNPLIIPIAAYKESIQYNPLNAETYLKLGLTVANFEKTNNVDLLFNLANKRDPNNIFINYYIGNYYLWNQNLEKALNAFRKIFAISNSSERFLESYFLNILNEVYLTNPEYSALAKINPSSYIAYLTLADFLKSKNRWNESKKAYYRAIKLAPLDEKSELIYRLASISASNKDFEEVRKIDERFKHYITSKRDINRLFSILFIKCLYAQKDYTEIIKRADKLIEIAPYDYKSYYYKGLSFINLDRKAEGISQLEKAARLSPENINLLRTLAFFYESTKLYDKALAKWQLILKSTKDSVKDKNLYSEAFNNILRIKTKLNMAN